MRHLTIALSALLLAASPVTAQLKPPAPLSDNPEMAKMFAEDQAIRENVKPEWFKDMTFVRKMWADDTARRERTRALLDQGKLATAEDYYAAAFVSSMARSPRIICSPIRWPSPQRHGARRRPAGSPPRRSTGICKPSGRSRSTAPSGGHRRTGN